MISKERNAMAELADAIGDRQLELKFGQPLIFDCARADVVKMARELIAQIGHSRDPVLVEMLRADEPPDTTGVGPGSYTVTLVSCDTQYSVTGPGIHNRHDVPVFVREADAESMFRAGQRQRSLSLMQLLDEDR